MLYFYFLESYLREADVLNNVNNFYVIQTRYVENIDNRDYAGLL